MDILNELLNEDDAYDFGLEIEREYNKMYPPPEDGTRADRDGIAITYQESKYPPSITLGAIFIPKIHRGKGIGAEIMQKLVDYADKNNAMVTLTASTDFGASSVSRLKRFYKQFDFVENKGRNKNFRISDTMYRMPQT